MNPYIKPARTRWNVINLGAGVQSSVLALIAGHGAFEDTPDAAIFADTGAEPESVYRWLDWLEGELPFPVIRVRANRSLEEDAFRVKTRRSDGVQYTNWSIPVFTKDNGKVNKRMRQCTYNYKIAPLESALKKLVKRKRGDYSLCATQWFGISTDEVQRTRISRQSWFQYRYPLIERGMSRADCIRFMEVCGYPKPPRSACVMCPYHSDEEWLRLKSEEPLEFERAVAFERRYQVHSERYDLKHLTPYLHRSCVPLGEVEFKGESDSQWGDECQGMCGV